MFIRVIKQQPEQHTRLKANLTFGALLCGGLGWYSSWWCVQLSLSSFGLLLIWHPFPALTDSFLCCFFLELELWKIKPQTPAPLTSSLAPAPAHPSGQHLSSSITLGWIAARDRKIRNYVKMLWIQQRGLIPITAPLPFPSSCHVISIPSLPPALGLSQKLLCGFCRAHFFWWFN